MIVVRDAAATQPDSDVIVIRDAAATQTDLDVIVVTDADATQTDSDVIVVRDGPVAMAVATLDFVTLIIARNGDVGLHVLAAKVAVMGVAVGVVIVVAAPTASQVRFLGFAHASSKVFC